jgi:hypothetical protein
MSDKEVIETLEAELKRLEKACAEWAEVSQSNYQRAKAAEAKLAKLIGGAETALEEWNGHINKGGWFKVSMDQAMSELRADVKEAKT